MVDSVFDEADVYFNNFPSGIFAVSNAFAKKNKDYLIIFHCETHQGFNNHI
jgi:hypothetical protein